MDEGDDNHVYEDELYKESESENSDDERDIEEELYRQVHFSSNLQIKDQTVGSPTENENETRSFPEILVEDSNCIILGAESAQKIKRRANVAVSGEDSEEWDIDDMDHADPTQKKSSIRYYDQNTLANIFCHNCDQKGHMMRDCPQPKKVPSCYLCGELGHQRYACPNDICYNCKETGHISKDCPAPRVKPWQIANQRCMRCKFYGHIRKQCTEVWRQYHVTTVHDVIIKPTDRYITNKKRYCYNCASNKHFGEDCEEERYSKRPVYSQFIVNYDKCVQVSTRNAEKIKSQKGGEEKPICNTIKAVKHKRETNVDEKTYEIPVHAEVTTNQELNVRSNKMKKSSKANSTEDYSAEHSETVDEYIVTSEVFEEECDDGYTSKVEKCLKQKASKEHKQIESSLSKNKKKKKASKESSLAVTDSIGTTDLNNENAVDFLSKIKDKLKRKRKNDTEESLKDKKSKPKNVILKKDDQDEPKKKKAKVDKNVISTQGEDGTNSTENTVTSLNSDLRRGNPEIEPKKNSFIKNLDFIPLREHTNKKSTTLNDKAIMTKEVDISKAKEKQKKKRRENDLDYVTLHNLQTILTDSEDEIDQCDMRTRLESQRSSPSINVSLEGDEDEGDEDEEECIIIDDKNKDQREKASNRNNRHRTNNASFEFLWSKGLEVDHTKYDPNDVMQQDLVAYGLINPTQKTGVNSNPGYSTAKPSSSFNSRFPRRPTVNTFNNHKTLSRTTESTFNHHLTPSRNPDVRVIHFNEEKGRVKKACKNFLPSSKLEKKKKNVLKKKKNVKSANATPTQVQPKIFNANPQSQNREEKMSRSAKRKLRQAQRNEKGPQIQQTKKKTIFTNKQCTHH